MEYHHVNPDESMGNQSPESESVVTDPGSALAVPYLFMYLIKDADKHPHSFRHKAKEVMGKLYEICKEVKIPSNCEPFLLLRSEEALLQMVSGVTHFSCQHLC